MSSRRSKPIEPPQAGSAGPPNFFGQTIVTAAAGQRDGQRGVMQLEYRPV